MAIYREKVGVFAPITALSINDNGTFKTIAEAWINDNGTFKKVFSSERQYHDPSAYYDIPNATGGALARTNSAIESAYEFRGYTLVPCNIPQVSGSVNDIDWSMSELIVIETGAACLCDALSTSSTQPSSTYIEFNGGGTVSLGGYLSTNLNYAVRDRGSSVNQAAAYEYLKITQHAAEFADKYSTQLGVRWRWHSKVRDMYFEHIFTNASMIITPV
ncbi:hypothetical protein IG608_08925 [Pectobacterium sp. A113-S21-F16]|uniref:hypothetical protein n=1 Tax=Pectobacterium quasiaquaticum TaxID=2774015 RepID=UPI001876062B|nr:hypothetical protein [Pectobacterium quasiaquaticum]MBE5221586.1 hypothetical protein [Pectobacterium quasiaquaticum]